MDTRKLGTPDLTLDSLLLASSDVISLHVPLSHETAHLLFPNVLITPHQAFLTHEALHEIARVTVRNILAGANGPPFLEGTALS